MVDARTAGSSGDDSTGVVPEGSRASVEDHSDWADVELSHKRSWVV
jgi:hypothetical protein